VIYLGRFFASFVDSGLTRQSLVLDEVFRVCPVGPPGSGSAAGAGAVNGTKGSDGRAGSELEINKCREGAMGDETGDVEADGNRVGEDGEDGEDGDQNQVQAEDMVWRWEYGGEEVVWRGMLSAEWDSWTGVAAGARDGMRGRMTRCEVVVCESEGRAKGAGQGQGQEQQWQWGLPDHVVRMLQVSTVCGQPISRPIHGPRRCQSISRRRPHFVRCTCCTHTC
jgi:hypothetical protein